MNIAKCKSCQQPIVWRKTSVGKNMPCNVDPSKGLIVDGPFEPMKHESHFATCPAAKTHRRDRS